jgi:alpha-ketoglutarate-dependent taurine dioxygenase
MNAPLSAAQSRLMTQEFKHFRVVPCTPTIGGTVEGLHLSRLNDEVASELRTALWTYGVLFAREQHLDHDQHKALARVFSDELEMHTFGKTLAAQGHPEVLLIQKKAGQGQRTTTDAWHHDVTGRSHPNVAAVLQADEVPFGADTMWASASAAYERLPYALKLMFLNLEVEHDLLYFIQRHDYSDNPAFLEKVLKAAESNTHPAVINHPVTGKLCLFVGNGYVKRVHGYNTDMSDAILQLANQLPRTPELQVRHQWRKGDIAIWDNFGTTHYGVSGDVGDQFRRLYRVAAWSPKVRPTLDRAAAMRELLANHTSTEA